MDYRLPASRRPFCLGNPLLLQPSVYSSSCWRCLCLLSFKIPGGPQDTAPPAAFPCPESLSLRGADSYDNRDLLQAERPVTDLPPHPTLAHF